MPHNDESTIIGLMSGTSLDGIDLACCHFSTTNGSIQWQLLASETIPYPESWTKRLSTLENATAYEYALADVELGHLFGETIRQFVEKHNLTPDYVASHGHTIFHQPQHKLTTQIGDGDAIAAESGIPVIFNFRKLDVALGGQGAPLVPIGDQLLFGQYDACLNLGGIANISYGTSSRTAFDISPCNMALNFLALSLGKPYDKDGIEASKGNIVESLLQRMNKLPFYLLPPPKSLGKEWFVENFKPLLDEGDWTIQDLLRTTVEHIAIQISHIVNNHSIRTLLVTGGGTKNKFLISRIQHFSPKCQLTVPENNIIDYKEAIIFALLGYLRLQGQVNALSSVTGASRDSSSGNFSSNIF